MKHTSRLNSSDPARGRSIQGSTSIPGASILDGGTATELKLGLRSAWCAGSWNAQFLQRRPDSTTSSYHLVILAYFIVDATPPLRITFSCSVNITIFAKGYSTCESTCKTSLACAVKKKSRPHGTYILNHLNKRKWNKRPNKTYRAEVGKYTGEKI